jgi:hypothetical protein
MKTFQEFMSLCEASDGDAASQLGWGGGASIIKTGAGGKIGQGRKKTAPEIRRTKAVGGGKTEPVKSYKPRKDIGQQRGSSAPAPGRGKGAAELKPGTAGTQGSAAMTPKERQRKAYLERKAKESGKEQPKTASQAIAQAKPKAAEKPAAKPRRKWEHETGGGMTRQERDAARNKEKTAAAQKTKKSSTEILAQMRKEYEEKGGKWNSKVAVQMRAKAKAAAQASES